MKLKYFIAIAGTLLVVLAFFGIYIAFFSPEPEKTTVNVEDSVSEVVNEQDRIEELASDPAKSEELKQYQEELNEKYSQPESIIDYLAAISTQLDTNRYSSVFIYDRYIKDIHNRADPDKLFGKREVIKEAMNRLTRDGTLEKLEYQDVKWTTAEDSVRVITDFYYEGLTEPVRATILVQKKEMENLDGHDHSDATDYYYIATSIWEIIDTIERGVAKQ